MKLQRGQSAAENARVLLPKLAKKYFQAGRKAFRSRTPSEDLHPFRIATKRFRYTLELFQPVYGAGLERYLKALRELQAALGEVSDNQTIATLLKGDPAIQTRLQSSLRKKLKDLRLLWVAFDREGELERWKTYLASERPRRR